MVNKKKIVLLSVIGIFLVLVGIYFVGTSTATDTSTILRDQEVEGLTFTNANLSVDKGISTLSVSVTNTNKEAYLLNYIEIVVKDDKENVTGTKNMKNWYFKNLEKNYYIFADTDKKNNNILSIEGTWIKVNKEKIGGYELFSIIEK